MIRWIVLALLLACAAAAQPGPVQPASPGYWKRSGTTVSPRRAGDSVAIGTTVLPATTPLVTYSAGLRCFGDSITYGSLATSPIEDGYCSLLGMDVGGSFLNTGVSGYQAADVSVVKVYPLTDPAQSHNPVSVVMVGANDATYYGPDADKQANYRNILSGIAAWLAIPRASKIWGQDATVTATGTWAVDDTLQAGLGRKSNTNGDTLSFEIVTAGAPIYIGYLMTDGNGGTASVTVDGAAAGTITAAGQNGAAIDTHTYHTTSGVGLFRHPVAAGAHQVVVTVTSATDAGNVVTFLWAGTKPPLAIVGAPQVFLGGITQNTLNDANALAYDGIVQAVATQLLGDGLPVFFVPTRPYVTPGTDFADTVHPNSLGHQNLRDAFATAMRPSGYGGNGITLANGQGIKSWDGATPTPSLVNIVRMSGLNTSVVGGLGGNVYLTANAGADGVGLIVAPSTGNVTAPLGHVSAKKGLLEASTAAKPACAVGIRGMIYVEKGAADVADQPFLCAKKSDNSYEWIQLVVVP